MMKIFLTILLFSVIYGDVMYEMEVRTSGMLGLGNGLTTVRNFIKSDRMRTEVKSENPLLGNETIITIVRLDKGVIWTLNPEKKNYVERLFDTNVENSISDTFNLTPEFNIEKTGETKEILKVKCEKYIVSLDMNSEDEKIKINQTMWLGKNFFGYDEIKEFNNKVRGRFNEVSLVGLDSRVLKELQKKISEIDGFPMEITTNLRIENNDTTIELNLSSIIKKLTTVPISDRVFEIPEGYSSMPIPDND